MLRIYPGLSLTVLIIGVEGWMRKFGIDEPRWDVILSPISRGGGSAIEPVGGE